MKRSSYCYTTSSNHLCKQSPHSSTAFQISMSSFIYHILLSLTDLSLIYSCRLHVQSICHVTRLINLSSYRLHTPRSGNLPTHYSTDQSTYQLHALQWGNLPTSYSIDQPMLSLFRHSSF